VGKKQGNDYMHR